MKYFQHIFAFILLCAAQSMYTKGMRKPATPSKPSQLNQPTVVQASPYTEATKNKPEGKQPSKKPINVQPTNYAQALNTIRTMPTQKIMVHNSLTNEFITFVTSLQLSDIETKALLEAGAYSHATWTGNNEQDKQILTLLNNHIAATSQRKQIKPQEPVVIPKVSPEKKEKEPRAREPKKTRAVKQPAQKVTEKKEPFVAPKSKPEIYPIQAYPATHNLILLIDPEKVETLESYSRAMVQDALMGMYEQTAPIIMTSNVLEIITSIRQRIGEKNLQQLRTSSYNQVVPFAQQLVNAHKLHESYLNIILMSMINFDTNNLNYYFHTSSNIVLIIPQQYITTNVPNAANLNTNDQMRACGFNPHVFTKIDNVTPEMLLPQLKTHQSQLHKEQFITHLLSSFTPQKQFGELLNPAQDTKWAIYISGHGGPAYQSIGNVRQIIPQIARIAGLTMRDFTQLMKFFDDTLNVAYIHYTTCFSGGYNQTFVNHVLSSLDVNFIVSSEGIGERKTSGVPLHIMFSSQAPHIRPSRPFTKFFDLLRLFISNPEQFVKIKEAKKDPVVQILLTIHPQMTEENQPFVRFPGAEVFGALSLNKKTKVLTQTIVKAHEIEKRAIDVSNFDIIIANPLRINAPLNLGTVHKDEHRAIVSPTPKTMEQYHETIHVFKEIICQATLQTLLFNSVYLNTNMNTQTFIIKELKGIQYQASGLPQSNQNIHNLIIQINKQIIHSGYGEMTANVNIAFEYNNMVYQSNVAIQGFSNSNGIYQAFATMQLTAQAAKTANMNTIAAQFLTPQEINKLKKPITLETIVEFIDAKIDVQEPSLKETAVKKELTELVKQMPK